MSHLDRINRLLKLQKKGVINLYFSDSGECDRIELKNCCLLIRISTRDKKDLKTETEVRNHLARIGVVSDSQFLNIDEAEESTKLDFKNYSFPKKGKERILKDLETKLRSNGFSNLDITHALDSVQRSFK